MEKTKSMEQIIMHVDMDAFYASVEIRDNPALRGKPLIIGALPNERGVVATCSYEARKFGVHSGMNIKEAYRLCPGGIYMHPNMDKYSGVSKQLHDIWNVYSTASEYIALDEAYLDITEKAETIHGAREVARYIKRRTRRELGLTCSIGVAYSKTAAKIASEEKKPNGYFEIPTQEDFVDLIIDRPVRILYTVGEKTAEKLNGAGIFTVRDVRENGNIVRGLLGKQGQWITQLATGIDRRKVTPYRPEDAKSIGREITFQQDVLDYDYLKDVLFLLALSVDHRAKRVGLYGRGVSLKVTYGDMKGISRSRSVDFCDSPMQIYHEAAEQLEHIEKKPVRLIGVSLYNLSDELIRQMTIEDYLEDQMAKEEAEMADILHELQERYHLDFAGHLDQLYHVGTLHRTVEYMRKQNLSE